MDRSRPPIGSKVVQLTVGLDPANPAHGRLLETLSLAGYYDPAAECYTGCDELIRVLLGRYLGVFPWSGAGALIVEVTKTPSATSGNRITPNWCPPAFGGRR